MGCFLLVDVGMGIWTVAETTDLMSQGGVAFLEVDRNMVGTHRVHMKGAPNSGQTSSAQLGDQEGGVKLPQRSALYLIFFFQMYLCISLRPLLWHKKVFEGGFVILINSALNILAPSLISFFGVEC